eukprot:gb/GFBE01004760.1/.p1 GENE.gb/GFBE01004760.1/~~gb/GFBE01004760.1/.p1  ORF type:complete len:282 (+),score=66.57 gb/GFBE01004760.1/:1-846(+)
MVGEEHVVLVPGSHKMDLLTADEGLRIQADDGDSWQVPSMEERRLLIDFLNKLSSGSVKRHATLSAGIRLGWKDKGVFLHAEHVKRYFGMTKSSASVMLITAAPEAVPLFHEGQQLDLLASLAGKIPTISDEVRSSFLRATFELADRNGNGKLSRPELGSMLRKMLNTLTAKDVEQIMEKADSEDSHQISYREFVDWLHRDQIDPLAGHLKTSVCLVRASFRLWDQDGDGLVRTASLEHMLKKSCAGLADHEVKSLVRLLDATNDGKVDYDEFVDFLFHRK